MKKIVFILMTGLYLGNYLATAQCSKLLDFNGSEYGENPKGSLTLSGNVLYGMTYYGGANNMGCIFKINTDGTGYTKLLDFSGTVNGSYPCGSLTLSGDFLYGMTSWGGAFDCGCIFSIHTDGSGYDEFYDFNIIDGWNPLGSLIISGDELYGMIYYGPWLFASSAPGSIFKININSKTYTELYVFSGTANGSYPQGSLTISGNVLYGLTKEGGANDKGCIFKINTDGSGYTQLLDFNGADNGSYPSGSLILSGNVLYGMTYRGGANDLGCLFSIKTDGTEYVLMLDFDGTDYGSHPRGSLILTESGILYGMTDEGGTNNLGCIFKYDPSHSRYFKLLDFDGSGNGKNPYGDLSISDDAFYGMTYAGGAYDKGVLFKYYLPPSTQTSNITFPFVGINVANISWTNGSGEKRAVFVKEGTSTDVYPDDNTTYTSSSNWDSKGTQLGTSGYYCVYNGPDNSVPVTGLIPGTTYTARAFEYNGDEGNEQYQTNTETDNPNSFQTGNIDAIGAQSENPVQIYSDGMDIYAAITNCEAKAHLSVYDLSGVCITETNKLSEGQNRVTGNYHPGVYIVRLALDDRLFTQKVIIK